jgi:hypothetical protein
MKDYKIKCLEILKNIQNELSDIRDEIEFDGDGYGSKLDKEAKSIEKKIDKFIVHLMEEESE